MSTLIPKQSHELEREGVGSLVSDGLILAGVGALPLWLVASVLPGGVALWAVLFVVVGMGLGIVTK